MSLAGITVLIAVFAIGFIGTNAETDREIAERILRSYTNEAPEEGIRLRLGVYINSFYTISEQDMEYSVSMYFRQAWQDKRLAFQPSDGKKKIMIPEAMRQRVWTPDTFFRNEKRSTYHLITVPNVLLRINATGHVWYVTKITATFSCPMKLQKFPFDTQMCPMMFESFSHTMDTIVFEWLNSPVDVDKGVQLPQFTLKDVILFDCSQNYTAGAFPCLEIRYVLKRDVGFYILQIYIPSILIVIVSWFAFWFSVDAVSARAGTGLTTVLTILLLSAWSRTQLPKVSYATALDVWNFICFIFVITAFLEFVLVQFFTRGGGQDNSGEGNSKKKSWIGKVDAICRIAFPVAFLLFNIIYWALYAS